MELNFMDFVQGGTFIICLVVVIQKIKEITEKDKPALYEKLKAKHFYMILFVILCLPLSVVFCMKTGAYDGNTVLVIIGTNFEAFLVMAVFGTVFYQGIWKRVVAKKKELEGDGEG